MMKRLWTFLLATWMGLLAGLATPFAFADDTEIYLRQVPNVSEQSGRPNILFVLDRSGSMRWKDRDASGDLLYEGTDRLTRLKEALLQMLREVQNVNVGFMSFNQSGDGDAAVQFPITYIDELASKVPGEMDDMARLTIPVANSYDDAEEGLSSGDMFLDDKNLEMTYYSASSQAGITVTSRIADRDDNLCQYEDGTAQSKTYYIGNGGRTEKGLITGLRFTGIDIPQGATITNASILFTAHDNYGDYYGDPLTVSIKAADKKNPAEIDSDIIGNWSPVTNAEVEWDLSDAWVDSEQYLTPDIKEVIQEIVDRDDWESGEAMAIRLEHESGIGTRIFNDYYSSETTAPLLSITYDIGGSGSIYTGTISYSGDNATEFKSGSMDDVVWVDEYLRLGHNRHRGPTMNGFRFRDVRIPQGAEIKFAKLDFVRSHAQYDGGGEDDPLTLKIYAEDRDEAEEFVGGGYKNDVENSNLSSRPPTNASVEWDVTSVPKDASFGTPDIKSVIQEVVDRNGWLSGNSLALILDHSAGDGSRRVYSYSGPDEDEPHRPATLTVVYEEGSGGVPAEPREDEKQEVGLRFQNVAIPQGVKIKNAKIEFTSGFGSSEPATIVIHGEDVDHSKPFSEEDTITEREKTSSKLVWKTEPWLWTNAQYESIDKDSDKDLTEVVQEIVNRSDWCGNNAMSFILSSGSGNPIRNAATYDADPKKAPTLKVEYDITTVKDNSCMRHIFTKQIADANDDAEETTNDNNIMFLDSRTLDMAEKDGIKRLVGLRFQNIPINPGSEVVNAKLIFTATQDEGGSAAGQSASLDVFGEKTHISEPFTTNRADLSSRKKTSAEVDWSISSSEKWESGKRYESADIAPVVQEIINHSGWQAFNPLTIFVEGRGLRQASAFERNLTDAPLLQVEVKGSLARDTTTVRSRMEGMVENIVVDGSTPIVDTLYEIAMYLGGGPVTFGKDRGGKRTKRVSHRGSWENGSLVVPEGCTSSDPWAEECRNEKIAGEAKYVPPVFDQCQKTYIVFLTDGAPTANRARKLVEELVGHSCEPTRPDGEPYEHQRIKQDGTLEDRTNKDELCGVDVAKYMHEKDFSAELEGKQNVVLHAVGFNLGPYYDSEGNVKPWETGLNERAVPYLKALSKAGGGDFYNAASAADLLEIFRTIISSAMTESTSFAAPTLSVNTFSRLYHRNEVYFALFKPTHNQRWDGNIKKYYVCAGGGGCTTGDILDASGRSAVAGRYISENAKSYWSKEVDGDEVTQGGAGEQVLGMSSRDIYTYIGEAAPGQTHNIPIIESNNAVSTTNVTKELLGNEYMTDDQHEKIVSWIYGEDVMNEYDDEEFGSGRRWQFADPLHSSPVAITYGGTDDEPDINLFVGTNDGLIRMINSRTGKEEWAFLPQELLDIQEGLMINAKGGRIYGIDGTATFRIVDNNRDNKIEIGQGDLVHMFIGMRRGGRNLYALNVSDPDKPKLMWVIKGGEGDYQRLGQTWSRPTLTHIVYKGEKKTVMVFGGGYHGDDESSTGDMGNAIYIVDPDTGERLWWVSNKDADLSLKDMIYPIPSDISLIDSNGDTFTDRLYVGDIGGQLWRIDLPSSFGTAGSDGIGGILATVSDSEEVKDRRKFFYPPEVARLNDPTYSEQQDYDVVTITTGSRPSPLNADIHDRFYAFRDFAVGGLIDGGNGEAQNLETLEEHDLYDATPNVIQESDSEATVKAEVDKLREKDGWYVCLTENGDCGEGDDSAGGWIGEKGLASPVILDQKVFFTTYLPSIDLEGDPNDVCKTIVPEGESRLYALDLFTGGAVYNSDSGNDDEQGDLKRGDRHMNLRQGITSDIAPMFLEGGDIRLLSNDLSLLREDLGIRTELTATFWMQE